MKSSSKYKYSFHKNAGELAALAPDGRLRLWETSNGKLSSEWSPQSNLQITCSCLCWTYNAQNGRSRPKKETRKRSIAADNDGKSYLALGTLQGSILLLDTDMLEVKTIMEKEHTETVNDICFNSTKEAMFSASNDKNIIEWSYPSMNVKSKWKADKCSVTKLEASPDGTCLLTAGRSIKLWDIDTKQLLQKFTGHVNPVTSLHFVPLTNSRSYKDDCYFLSSAKEDQIVNAWHYDPSCMEKSAVSCFMTPDEPVAVDLNLSEEQQLHLSVACLGGRVNVFKHVLNGKMPKPINSSLKFQLVKRNSEEKKLPISHSLLAIKLLADDKSLLLVYGSPIRPTFEKIKLSSLENGCKLERDTMQNFLKEDSESDKKEKKIPKIENKSVVISSTATISNNRLSGSLQSQVKSKETSAKGNQELTLEDRLKASVAMLKDRKQKRNERPNAASLTQMLSQGLHSDDDKLIDDVLYKASKEAIVVSTANRLSSSSVLTLINKIVSRIQKNPARGHELTIWIRVLLNVHMTYLTSMPNLMSSLSTLYQTLDTRTKLYPKLSKLHGRLDLLLNHISHRKTSTIAISDVNNAVLSYEDTEEVEDGDGLSMDRIPDVMEDEDDSDEDPEKEDDEEDDEDDDDESMDESTPSLEGENEDSSDGEVE
eukprot:gene17807-19583_t